MSQSDMLGGQQPPCHEGFLFSVHHEKGHYQEGFERRICDSVSPGVSPKHRHRHNGVTE